MRRAVLSQALVQALMWRCCLQTYNITFLTQWINHHSAAAAALGKPLIVEEFGKQVHTATASPHDCVL